MRFFSQRYVLKIRKIVRNVNSTYHTVIIFVVVSSHHYFPENYLVPSRLFEFWENYESSNNRDNIMIRISSGILLYCMALF